MENNIIDANTVKLQANDKLLFDCNVLMYIFYSYGKYSTKQVKTYKSLFANAYKENCKMYIPSIEISEFVNTYVKNEYNRYLRRKNLSNITFNFKYDYRSTKDYTKTITEVKNIISKQILSIFKRLDDNFSELEISDIFDAPKIFDFNDRYYCKLAEKNSLIIITNDSDFSYSSKNVKIVTANSQLLASSSVP